MCLTYVLLNQKYKMNRTNKSDTNKMNDNNFTTDGFCCFVLLLFLTLLGTELPASCTLGKCYSTEPHPQILTTIFFLTTVS